MPILLDRDPSYYADLMLSLNGILFPGGGKTLWKVYRTHRNLLITMNDEHRSGSYELSLCADRENSISDCQRSGDEGDYFPVWATCLGFELLFVLESGNFSFSRCNELDTTSKIGITASFEDPRFRIFANVTQQEYEVS